MQTYSSNNAAVSGPRDPSFGGPGRANGRPPGNGPPPVTMGGPPGPPKPSVTISNGRDPRRASKRWGGTTEISVVHTPFHPSIPLRWLAHPNYFFFCFQARPTSEPLKVHYVTAILKDWSILSSVVLCQIVFTSCATFLLYAEALHWEGQIMVLTCLYEVACSWTFTS